MIAHRLVLAAIASLSLSGGGFAQAPATPPAGPPAATPAAPPACTPPLATPDDAQRPRNPPVAPTLPSCVDPQTRISHCRKADIDRYNAAMTTFNANVMAWNDEARRYVDSMNAWTTSAGDYAHCEIDVLNAETRNP